MDDKGHIKMKIKDILNRLDVIAEADAQPAQPPLVIPQSLTNKIANDPNNRTVAQQNPPIGSQSAQPVPKQNAGTAAGYKGSAGAQAIAKASGVADVNKIKAGQQLTLPDGTKYTVKPGDTLDKIAAANKGAAAPAAAPTNAPAAAPTNAPAPSADNEKLKQNIAAGAPAAEAPAATADSNAAAAPGGAPAAGAEGDGATPGAAAALANMGKPAGTPPAPADDLARMTQLAGAGKPAGGYGNFTGDQSAQPAPEEPAVAAPAAPAPNPDTVAPVVKTGTGGTLTTRDGKPVTSRSNDEIAWAQSHPYQPYPGPGWQEKQKAQGQKNLDALKGVGNKIANFFGGNKQPAAPAPQQGQSTQPEPAAPAGGYGKFNESELSIIKQLSGLK
jgi:LysM repeat protein